MKLVVTQVKGCINWFKSAASALYENYLWDMLWGARLKVNIDTSFFAFISHDSATIYYQSVGRDLGVPARVSPLVVRVRVELTRAKFMGRQNT